MENFEKCTVAMLVGPCLQHVTGNTSWLNQPQSAIINMTARCAAVDSAIGYQPITIRLIYSKFVLFQIELKIP